MWDKFGNTVNDAFYFVVDLILNLQPFFLNQAYAIGRVVLLIAILSAALNYALTGTGFKENVIKIMKATVFFLIVMAAYPRIIGFITSWTFELAEGSVYKDVKKHFDAVTDFVETKRSITVSTSTDFRTGGIFKNGAFNDFNNIDVATHNVGTNYNVGTFDSEYRMGQKHNYMTFEDTFFRTVTVDDSGLFRGLSSTRVHSKTGMPYTTVQPASVVKILFFLAGQCIHFADDPEKKWHDLPDFSRILKGLVCAGILVFTGVFALLEYLVCFLEFMLVASVGVILFPLSIWEGSKFLAEKYIGAIVGFFMKLLFCNIAILLMLYGFISIYYFMTANAAGFTGSVGEICFIVFSSLLFFYVCKSAPGIAQSLLTGVPSLNAAGAIGAVAGMAGAAAGVAGLAGKTLGAAKSAGTAIAGGGAKAAFGGIGALAEARSAENAVRELGGSKAQQAGAFISSLSGSAWDSAKSGALGLTRSLLGGNSGGGGGSGGSGGFVSNPHSWREDFLKNQGENGHQTVKEHLAARRKEGADRGLNYLANKEKK